MSAGRPQDRLPKKVVAAVEAQAANLAQKAIIDNVVVKITGIMALVKGSIMKTDSQPYKRMTKDRLIELLEDQDKVIVGVYDTLRLTREETAAIRATPEHTFPDERVQAILSETVDKITSVILDEEA
ncbi:hypothetical protein SEA_GILDA_72 [Microbacterium phage Gilda]|uniref:Uncharacterized protein n=6 Tax=Krampusvirus krampus TaxID=2734242 RepID=A0A4Y6ESF6_9CAUD|nr:hypothetical protein HOT40_gp72 [Microbacterium phage Krampus]AWY04527.1 hypothetical protein SEA_ANNASERENA_72 [Microbacterium phage AnnaSerena]QCQ57434.1 hypothetical protein SEA_RACHELLA_72 [Microbacterium phage Rachella]QDF18124.1 hypothetical protein SEA_ANAKIN_72 [Microbacterium phage Anakin]QDF18206.1 hypothetical protein SEA_NARUTORUN_72 [Microbacterium phage NarutoRun]QGH74024.1 hypothetical protein SEA_HIDDENLEAF_73 [Microbacterium phage Hiddenleaf]QNJ55694.1 hypothetical protein